MAPMAEHKVWTAEELLALSPAQRFRIVTDCIVTDLDQARVDIREHIARTESTRTPER